jgi:hypothetical protein
MNMHLTLIKSKGIPVTLVKKATRTYDTETGVMSTTKNSFVVYGYFFAGQDETRSDDNFTLAETKMLLATKQTNNMTLPEPSVGDNIVTSSHTYEIVSYMSTTDKANTLFYTCNLRG